MARVDLINVCKTLKDGDRAGSGLPLIGPCGTWWGRRAAEQRSPSRI